MDLSKEAKTLIKSNVVLKLVSIVTKLQLSYLVSHKLEQSDIGLNLFFSPFPTITREHENFQVAKLVSLNCKSMKFSTNSEYLICHWRVAYGQFIGWPLTTSYTH